MPPPSPDPDILQRIPLAARTVLDVGCGEGALAAAYRLMNPKVRLLGIELDPEAATQAADYFDEVSTGNLESEPLPFSVPEGIDCIVYNNILEHLQDPWELLRQHVDALSPDGMMLIRVPNMEHWRFASRLLSGQWEDDDDAPPFGPDPRWFNREGMQQRLQEIGLTLCDLTTRDRLNEREATEAFVDALTPALTALGIDPGEYARRAAPTHMIWRVRKTARPRIIVSGSMLDPVGGVSHVRVVHPLHAIGTDPLFKVSVLDRLDDTQRDGAPRIFVLHRPALTGQNGPTMLRSLMELGYLVVTEFDDHPDFFQMMQMGGEIAFRGVHALQTSTPALAEVLRKYNPEIAIFPNAIVTAPPIENFADSNVLTLFFGALNREPDWRSLMPAINAAAAKAGERLRFEVVHDRLFFDALDSPYKKFTPTCDYDTYFRLLRTSEVSFMPLGDTPFNRTKSDLKFIEAGSCRVAPLASTVVYSDTIEDGRTGLLFRDAQELYSHLLRLIATPELARDLGDAAREYVLEERMLAYQVGPRIAWYRSLWDRREALTAALHGRIGGELRVAA